MNTQELNSIAIKNAKKSLIASLLLIAIVLVLCIFSPVMRDELKDGVVVLFVCFLIITSTSYFISSYLKKKWIPVGMILSGLVSFGLIHLLEEIFLQHLFLNNKTHKYTLHWVAIIGVFVAVLVYLFDSYQTSKVEVKSRNIKFPIVNSLLFSLVVISIYLVVEVLSVTGTVLQSLYFLFRILFANWLVVFVISLFLFRYIYQDYEKRKKLAYLFYLVIFVFFLITCLTMYNNLEAINIQNVLSYMIMRVPFLFMIVLGVQVSYMIQFSKQEKEILKQESIASQLSLQQLKNQLSPHFLFNNINVLTSLIEEDPKRAVHFSQNLSTIYRYFLEQEKEDLVTLNDELTFAETYLSLFKDRFEEAIEYEVENIKENDYYIISTGVQQVLENVIKHNQIEKENPIRISVKKEDDYLLISNNCFRRNDQETSSKKGLKNMKERYSYFTNQKVIVEHTDDMFVVKLPLLVVSE